MTKREWAVGVGVSAAILACGGPDSAGRVEGDAPPSVPPPADDGTRPGWRLIWQDEFDGPAGTPPDTARWTPEVGGDGWGNEQLEHNTDRTDNAALDGDGRLAITARRESYRGNAYTSARLSTRGKFEQTYGRFEARLRMPIGQGMWPAFWLLGGDIGEVGWPACGEIDILEYKGQAPSIVYGTVHGPGYSGASGVGKEQPISRTDLSEDFHIYAVEWTPDRIRWFVDSFMFHELTPDDLPPGTRWVFDHDHFIILNLAVGGRFVGPLGPDVAFPQSLLVDYVRVYEKTEQ